LHNKPIIKDMTTNSPEATMLLISSTWDSKKTFKLMPIKPGLFVEGIFDLDHKILVMITTVKKDTFHMVPHLNVDGDPTKSSKGPRPNGKTYQEERRQLETFQEYYITEKAEIETFIKMVALNSDSFDYKQYTEKSNLIIEPEKKTLISI